ncbi:phage tail protein [Flavipsychrobacter stenotrophus]|uniref:Phage tail protein n=1 Tax=Flavipsychrobacter stenotrophus TaxID=2077091 RepID=A0A2S7SQC2_9BACT|nr:tail fiber protein [Flavipsychrobacter stenotrophus]PQJ09099.1 phage tail protein [Flavipsychrobacter stenotrophus]
MVDPFLGSIQYFSFDYAPVGYLQCIGQPLQVAQYQGLYSLMADLYGGNGTTTFNLPDYRGRAIVGAGTLKSGQNYAIGALGGAETASITAASLPLHSHLISDTPMVVSSGPGSSAIPFAKYPAAESATSPANLYTTTSSSANMAPFVTTQTEGGIGAPFSTMPQFIALTCCIAVVGLYPPRS